MNKEEHIQVITDREELYDKCENMEQLYDKYYLPLLCKHYSKTYELQEENKKQKEVIDKAMIELDTIINDLEKHGDEAPAPSKEELCKIFNILKEVSE